MKKKQTRGKKVTRLPEKLITAALNQAALDAVEAHRVAGQPLVEWKDGKIVFVSPDQVAKGKRMKDEG
jgi:hypothetical protein